MFAVSALHQELHACARADTRPEVAVLLARDVITALVPWTESRPQASKLANDPISRQVTKKVHVISDVISPPVATSHLRSRRCVDCQQRTFRRRLSDKTLLLKEFDWWSPASVTVE
jgi:hypothetical protein